MMIVAPEDLPTAAEIDPNGAAMRIARWGSGDRSKQSSDSNPGPTVDEALAFADEHKQSFFRATFETLQRIGM